MTAPAILRRPRPEPAEVVLYQTEIEPESRGGVIRGLQGRAVPYATWTNRGHFLESVAPGAFAKSISEAAAGLPLLLFHDDQRWPIGLSQSWDDKKDALYGDWRLDEGEEAQRAGQLARDGLLRWLSVGHSPIRSEWEYVDPDKWDPDRGPGYMDKVTRIEGRLIETSLLTTPAFASAQVLELYGDQLRSAEPRRPRGADRPSLRAWQRWRASLDG